MARRGRRRRTARRRKQAPTVVPTGAKRSGGSFLCSASKRGPSTSLGTTVQPHYHPIVCYRGGDVVLPPRDRARRVVALRRRRDRAPQRARRRTARGRQRPRWSCMRRRRRRGWGSTTCPHATCSNSMPSCGRRPSACRRRAASPRRWTSIRRTSSPRCRRSPAPCSTSSRTWRRSPRPRCSDTALAMARGNWSWSDEVLKALGLDHGRQEAAARRRPRRLEEPAGVGGAAARHAARLAADRAARGAPAARAARRLRSQPARGCGRRRATTRPPPRRRSRRARKRTSRRSCWSRPAPASARRWAMSRRPACGPRRTARRSGSRPTPATCSARSTTSSTGCTAISAEKRRRVVIRKGRENYLCLLNFQEAVMRTGLVPENAVGLGLLARWALASRDGDMIGGDLPAWLLDLLGRGRIGRLADRRGECIYSACEHYRKCFVERTIRRARTGRHRDRQPCAGDGAGGDGRARRRDAPARATCSTRAITCSTPPTARSARI